MVRVCLVLALAALLGPASAAASVPSAPSAPQVVGTTLPPGFVETTAWTVPDAATVVRFGPDGRVFVAGKSGVVYAFDGLGDTTPTVVADLRGEVYDGFERGLLGLAVDPRYAAGRPYLYVAYTYDKSPVPGSPIPAWNDDCPTPPGPEYQGCTVTGRISRLGPDGSEKVLVEDFCDQYPSHTMGTLAFGPDGALYSGAGEGAAYSGVDYGQYGDPVDPCDDPPGGRGSALTPPTAQGGALRAQSYRRPAGQPVSLDGALLRLDPDTGQAAAGNPPGDAQRRRIVAYGLRNPFRFTFRPGTGELWVGDVGFATWEEIDRVPDVSQVRNYGWPCYEGAGVQPAYAAAGLDSCTSLSEDATVKPVLAYAHGTPLAGCPGDSSAISGLAFYDGTAFPARYRGALFFADFVRGCIWTMYPRADGTPDPATVSTFASDAAGPADLEVGPDGALYYADVYDGEIRRIAALPDDTGTTSPPPAATPSATPPAATPATATPSATPPPASPTGAPPRLRAPRRLRMSRRGVVAIHLACPAASCRFSARLEFRGRTLGRASGAGTLRIRLSPRGKSLVRRGARLRLIVTRRSGTRTESAARTLRIRR